MILETGKNVLLTEANALRAIADRLDDTFVKAVNMIAECEGRAVLTGMGKSGLICRKISATLASTGTPSLFLHPAEAIHGDIGMIKEEDIVIAISNSGETQEITNLIPFLKRLGLKMISMTGNKNSTLARFSDIHLDTGIEKEACPINMIPTASTTAALAMGDALAIALFEMRGYEKRDFIRYHPGGQIGKQLVSVGELMHTDDRLPKVMISTPLDKAIEEITVKRMGVTAVVNDNNILAGIITDGDLRRFFQKGGNISTSTAGDCMTPDPLTVSRNESAGTALRIMEEKKITSLMVTDGKLLLGLIHIHDLWRIQMF